MRDSVVYFLQSVDDPCLYKIGVTTNMSTRFRTIKTACPFPIVLSHCLPGTAEDERHLHRMLANERRCGEWFEGDNTHYVAWATLETGSLDENVFMPWLASELEAIRQSRHSYVDSALNQAGIALGEGTIN